MEGNEVRRLRKEIAELSELFDQEMFLAFEEKRNSNKGRGNIATFSYIVEGVGGIEQTNFFELIESYGVDMEDKSQLNKLGKDLRDLSDFMLEKYDELSEIRGPKKFSRVLQEMKDKLINSPIMAKLSPEEQQKRLEMLELVLDEDGEKLRDETLERIESFVVRLEQETDSVRGAKMLLENPELMEMYEDLREMEDDLEKEQAYRKEQRTLRTKYNSLCISYQDLESIDSELRNPKITEERKGKLENNRKAIIKSLKETMTPEVCEELFGENDDKEPSQYQLMRALKGDIEDVAFQINKANGIVDKDVLARDVFDIEKVDAMQEIENAAKMSDDKAKAEKIKGLSKTKELENFAKKVELRRLLDDLLVMLKEVEELKKAAARYEELKAKPEKDLTEEEKQEMGKLLQKTVKLKNVLSRVSTLQKNIRDLASELHMINFENMNLDNPKVVSESGLKDVNRAIGRDKKFAKIRRDKACKRYGVDKKETTQNIKSQIKLRVEEIEKNKRKKIIENEGPGSNEVNAPANTPVQNSTQNRTPGNATPTPLNFGSKPAPINIPHSSFGNPRYPGVEPVQNNFGANVPPSASQNTGNSLEENQVNAPADIYEDQNSVEARLDFLMHKTGRVVDTLQVDDAEVQVNTIDPEHRQRVENGVVYRYARGANPDELYFVEEGLEMYLENPQKKLESVLKGLRERMIEELGSEELLEEFLDTEAKNDLLKDLVSKNPSTSKDARRKIISKLDEMNPGNEDLAYVSMAIALNSEIEPEKIDEVLGRTSQPYSRPCDMKKYVREEETKGFLGLGKKMHYVIEPTLLERNQKREERRAERYKSSLNSKAKSDGMLRPFEIQPEEKGETPRKENSPQRENNDPSKKPQRRRSKDTSNPGDR